jgi:hypothetical protein
MVPVAGRWKLTVWEVVTGVAITNLDPNPAGRSAVPPTPAPFTTPDHGVGPELVAGSVHVIQNSTEAG